MISYIICVCDVYAVIITGSPSLQVLCISGNPISDDGVSLISKELQYNKVLVGLEAMKCGLSVKGALLMFCDKLLNYYDITQVPSVSVNC